jgi:hypothetical protein
VSHFLESAGIPTTGISLVREHTEQMRLPRFLWVPFELGRPFGAPNAPDFQRRVLRLALELLERQDGPIVLEDFPDDAPQHPTDEAAPAWSCPVAFARPAEDRPTLVAATFSEIEHLAPWHELYTERRGRAAPPASSLERGEFLRRLGDLAEGVTGLDTLDGLPIQEWVRLGCDDLHTWYLEAAQGQPGRGSSTQLRDWFWRDTSAAQLFATVASVLLDHPNPLVKGFALRGMVPREYFARLLPGATPFI